MEPGEKTVGVILAGGLARRLGGGDKGLRRVGGRTVLERVSERLQPQVTQLVLNANGDPARFRALGLTVIADGLPGQLGPLAGLLAGLEWAAAQGAAWVVSVPGDAPFLPDDLVARLHAVRGTGEMACAGSGGRVHPVVCTVRVTAAPRLRALIEGGMRRAGAFTEGAAVAEWPTAPVDPFFNVNTAADLDAAERLAATL